MMIKFKVIAFCPGVNLNEGYDTGVILELEEEHLCQFSFISALMDAGCLENTAGSDDLTIYDEPNGIRIHYAVDNRPMLTVREI
jgi:hypothetical protein